MAIEDYLGAVEEVDYDAVTSEVMAAAFRDLPTR
jgi:hypothetical protein